MTQKIVFQVLMLVINLYTDNKEKKVCLGNILVIIS